MSLVNRIMELKEKIESAEKADLILQGEIKNMEVELKEEMGTVDLSEASEILEKKERINEEERKRIEGEIHKLEEIIS